ncbi:MAG: hypothetical protein JW751_30745 [Polyangiaceae bacterium]|nr:hypothetical protein [Polyangiaceae bacterium]
MLERGLRGERRIDRQRRDEGGGFGELSTILVRQLALLGTSSGFEA